MAVAGEITPSGSSEGTPKGTPKASAREALRRGSVSMKEAIRRSSTIPGLAGQPRKSLSIEVVAAKEEAEAVDVETPSPAVKKAVTFGRGDL